MAVGRRFKVRECVHTNGAPRKGISKAAMKLAIWGLPQAKTLLAQPTTLTLPWQILNVHLQICLPLL